MIKVQVIEMTTLTDCVCLAPCKSRCNVCGVVLCRMTNKNRCETCSKWFFSVIDRYKGTNLFAIYFNHS